MLACLRQVCCRVIRQACFLDTFNYYRPITGLLQASRYIYAKLCWKYIQFILCKIMSIAVWTNCIKYQMQDFSHYILLFVINVMYYIPLLWLNVEYGANDMTWHWKGSYVPPNSKWENITILKIAFLAI